MIITRIEQGVYRSKRSEKMKAPSELISGLRLLSVYPTLSGVFSTF